MFFERAKKKKKMKFRKVSAQRVTGGLTAAAVLAAGGGWMIRSIRSFRQTLTSTDYEADAERQKREKLWFLLLYPTLFKSFFKKDVVQLAKDTRANMSTRTLALNLLAKHEPGMLKEAASLLTYHEMARINQNHDLYVEEDVKQAIRTARDTGRR